MNTTRLLLFIISVPVLGMLNFWVYEKEQIRQSGEIVYLELVPADPRSLMQGDFMRLRFAMERPAYEHWIEHEKEIDRQRKRADPTYNKYTTPRSEDFWKQGYFVVQPDEQQVARFIRLYDGETLAPNEKLIKFRKKLSREFHVVPDSFLFQEGHASIYENAQYGVFQFQDARNYLLIGLADNNLKILGPR